MDATLTNSSPKNLYIGAPELFTRPLTGRFIAYNSLEPSEIIIFILLLLVFQVVQDILLPPISHFFLLPFPCFFSYSIWSWPWSVVSKTFHGLKIGRTLNEIWPLLFSPTNCEFPVEEEKFTGRI